MTNVLWLVLNIVLSSTFLLCVKWLHPRREDVVTVGALNYIAGALVALLVTLASSLHMPGAVALVTGGLNGVAYFIAFFFVAWTISWKGATILTVLSRLSILAPIAYAVIGGFETPTILQGLGVLAACAALVLTAGRGMDPEPAPRRGRWMLIAFVSLASLSRLCQEWFKLFGRAQDQPYYVLAGFFRGGRRLGDRPDLSPRADWRIRMPDRAAAGSVQLPAGALSA